MDEGTRPTNSRRRRFRVGGPRRSGARGFQQPLPIPRVGCRNPCACGPARLGYARRKGGGGRSGWVSATPFFFISRVGCRNLCVCGPARLGYARRSGWVSATRPVPCRGLRRPQRLWPGWPGLRNPLSLTLNDSC